MHAEITYCTVGLTQEPAKQQLIDNVACGAATGTTSRYDFLVVPNAPKTKFLKGFFDPPLRKQILFVNRFFLYFILLVNKRFIIVRDWI